MINSIDEVNYNYPIVNKTIINFNDHYMVFNLTEKVKKVYLDGSLFLLSIDNENKILDPLHLLPEVNVTFDNFDIFIINILTFKISFNANFLNIEQIKLLKIFIDLFKLIEIKIDEENTTFFDKFINELDWNFISGYPYLSEKFIERYKTKINWKNLPRNRTYSETFVEKHINKLNISILLQYQYFSESFMENHKNILNWDYVFKYQNLSEEFIEKFKYKVNN